MATLPSETITLNTNQLEHWCQKSRPQAISGTLKMLLWPRVLPKGYIVETKNTILSFFTAYCNASNMPNSATEDSDYNEYRN